MVRVVLFLALIFPAAYAQTAGTATLLGTVTDASGAVVAGAKATVVNVETSFTSTTVTNNEGYYYVPYLNPGNYQINVEAAGFKKYVRGGITLRTNEQPRIDVQLEVGSVAESIEVAGAPPLLETETAIAGAILEGQTIVKIPVLMKMVFSTLHYLPGTQVVNGVHLVGQRERALAYTLDGLSGKEPVLGGRATNRVVNSTLDAFQEVKVYSTGVPAEYGHSGGGLLSAVFRTGTNEFHGNLEDRYVNNTLMHRQYFDLLPQHGLTYHEITGVFAGPVRLPKIYNGRDKTFFLFGLARHHEKASETFIGDVPSADMLNGDFSFGGLGNPLYDPLSTRMEGGRWMRDPIPGNRIPASRFDPVARNFLGRNPFAPPNSPPGFTDRNGPHQNLIAPTVYRSYRTRFDIKFDHQFASHHKIFGRYSQARHRAFNSRWFNEIAWKLLDFAYVPIPIDQRNVVVSDVYTITPTMINEVRLGMNRRRYTRRPESVGQGWARQLGIPNAGPETFPDFVNQGGGRFFRMGAGGEEGQTAEDFTFQNNLTKVSGKHTFKGGYEVIRTRYNSLVESLPSGRYFMGGTDFPFAPRGTTGNDFAALLLGSAVRAEFTKAVATWLPRWWSHAFYFQDDYKPVRNLTFSLGIRWSYESPFSTKHGRSSQFDPAGRDPITGRPGAITHPKGLFGKRDLNNFQPRLGMAWNFHPRLVFRGNFGVMSQDVFTAGVNQNFEEYFATASVQPPPGDPRVAFRLSEGPPPFNFNPAADGSVPFIGTNFSARGASWYDPNTRMPYIMNWSAGFQGEFRRNLLTELIYQGSAGVGLLNNWDLNVVPLDISRDPVQLELVRQQYQNFRPYPQFGGIRHYSNYGHNTYHGLTLRGEKRYSRGISLNAFYTFSKTLDDADNDGSVNGVTFYNRRLEKGRANYDVRNRFVTVFLWQLPMGKGRRFLHSGPAEKILGGWDFAYTHTIQGGHPITITFADSPFNYLPGVLRPNQVLPNDQVRVKNWTIGPNRFPVTAQNRYLNIEGFQYPAAFTPGTLGRNTLEATGINWAQFSLSKEFPIRERLKFLLRWDMNNPFKRPRFSNPNTTFSLRNPGPFGRHTGTEGSFHDVGGRLHSFLVLRLEW